MWQADRGLTALAIGPVGERREARRGTHPGTGEPTMKAQVLVGTTLLHAETAGSYAEGDRLTQLASMLAERSERAQASGTGT
ncbi:hypothetical protein [Streptomyces peucetius]|nr:hypothetical protein CGZ69_00275 [Streptomyces peucetius subsp. caesius ATCC 27952]